MTPLAPERHKVQLTIGKNTYDKLRRVQDPMRHIHPNGDLAVILDRALTLLLEHLQRTKLAAAKRPRAARSMSANSRYIPAAVRREVWARDGGRCAFVGANGRCTEEGFLAFHHVTPYADGGETSVDNLELRWVAQNAYEAERYFGPGLPFFLRECRAAFRAGSGPS